MQLRPPAKGLPFAKGPSAFARLRRTSRPIQILQKRVRAKQDGGADRDRTDDLKLAKLALSQLSYGPVKDDQRFKWWARDELNVRPHAYQACALTT